MGRIAGVQSTVSFTQLGGRFVSIEEIVQELRRLPLDGILGELSSLSLDCLHHGSEFDDPRFQGRWLNPAIVDDFPCPLARAAEMYAPGRVPITGERHLLVHEQNLAWLTNAALLYADRKILTDELSAALQRRVYRLLLIVNDHLDAGMSRLPNSLKERREFCLQWMRSGQFNNFSKDAQQRMWSIERQRKLFTQILPRYFPDLEIVFREASGGADLDLYFRVLTFFNVHFAEVMGRGAHWLSKQTLTSNIRFHRDEVDLVLRQWTVTGCVRSFL